MRNLTATALPFLLSLSLTGSAAAARIEAGPPRWVAAAPIGPAVDAQFRPAAASNGSGYFVAWSDFWSSGWDLSQTNVYGAPLSSDGTTTEPRRFLLRGIDPAIATDGMNYLVAAGALCDSYGECPTGIVAVPLDPSGDGVRPIRLETSLAGDHTGVRVTWNGRAYLVAWRRGAQLFAAILDRSGELIRSPSAIVDGVADAVVAPAAQAFFVSWIDVDGSLRKATLSDEGQMGSPSTLASAAAPPLFIAFSGREHAVSFVQGGSRRVSFLAADGALIRSVSVALGGEVSILATGDRFLVVGEEKEGRLTGRLLGSDGTDLAAGSLDIVPHPEFSAAPALASDGRSIVLCWTSGREGASMIDLDAVDVRTTRSAGTSWSSGRVIGLSARRQEPASLACDGSSCLAFWYERNKIRFVREDFVQPEPTTEGTLLSSTRDAAEFLLDVGFNGSFYLPVWLETTAPGSRLLALRTDRDGRPLDAQPLTLPLPYYDLRVVSDGSGFLIASRDLGDRNRIVAVRLRASGQLLDTHPFDLLPGRLSQEAFALTRDGEGYLLGWAEMIENGFLLVYAARLDRNGSLNSDPRRVITQPDRIGEVAVAAEAGRRMVAWTVRENPLSFNRRLRAAWLGEDGEPVGAILDLTDNEALHSGPRMIPMLNGFAVMWHRTAENESIHTRARFVPYGGGNPGAEQHLPSLIFAAVPLTGERFAVLTRGFLPALGHVTRAAVSLHGLAAGRRRAVRQ